MKSTAQILRDYRGPALFSFGFRPFFLLASIWAVLTVPLWMLSMSGAGETASDAVTRNWHVHEMLFGYTSAVIIGYMTVAGANWTGRYPVAGWPVILLALLWVAGRVAMLMQSVLGPVAALVDAAFLVLFALALWREQLAARNRRGMAPCVVISLLAIANVGFHMSAVVPGIDDTPERAALGLITFLIALMGGRLVPSFTHNWMAQRGLTPEPTSYGRFDVAALAMAGVGIVSWIVMPRVSLSGYMLIAAGGGIFIRLLRWRGWVAVREGMVIILHIAYLWCAFGLFMLGWSILAPSLVPASAAVHALTVGTIGVMTLAVMTRICRSHTGRERRADVITWMLYGMINAAAAVRVLAPFLPSAQMELFILSTACWSLAFGFFIWAYGSMLVRPWHRKV